MLRPAWARSVTVRQRLAGAVGFGARDRQLLAQSYADANRVVRSALAAHGEPWLLAREASVAEDASPDHGLRFKVWDTLTLKELVNAPKHAVNDEVRIDPGIIGDNDDVLDDGESWPLSTARDFNCARLEVLFCDDDIMSYYKELYLHEEGTTDVLSITPKLTMVELDPWFAFNDSPNPSDCEDALRRYHATVRSLGRIIISLPVATKQAHEHGTLVVDEIRILLVHGTLHLLGFDHDLSIDEHNRMAEAEQALLLDLGWKGTGLCELAS